MENKKGAMGIGSLVGIGVSFVVVVLVLAFGASIVADVDADQTAGSVAKNTTGEGLSALSKIGQKLPTLATVVVAAIIIGVLIAGFAVYKSE